MSRNNLSRRNYVIVLLSFLLVASCGGETKEIEKDKASTTEPKVADNQVSMSNKALDITEVNESLESIADTLRVKLSKKALGFTSDLIALSGEKRHSDNTAKLIRKYDWTIAFPVTIAMGDTRFFTKKGSDKIMVNIPHLTVGRRFSYGNKKATTLENRGWKKTEEDSRDEYFWNKLDEHTRKQLAKVVYNDKKVTDRMRNKAITMVIAEINKTLEGTGAENNKFEFVIERIR